MTYLKSGPIGQGANEIGMYGYKPNCLSFRCRAPTPIRSSEINFDCTSHIFDEIFLLLWLDNDDED
uniref:Uncharacterized protein n=1 Tax=Romanomermis culicivorax TaxID=13658 RepID=A0A915KP15_ROMCU